MSEFTTERPIYTQLAEFITRQVVRGDLPPGERLPSARDFAAQHVVNPNTAARAFQELERGGLIVTRRGLGSFVTEDARRIRAARAELIDAAVTRTVAELRALGLSNTDIQAALVRTLEVAS